ncbi:DUF2515 family protein [Bacillus pinisoli]|uniref:DUF2515 family protein n=1 Tax=Bacillus pinisoli TaxID=2901866 RepID=UPI001FF38EA3|nr:DUF2515 family protein [Bacillus pinisoli]
MQLLKNILTSLLPISLTRDKEVTTMKNSEFITLKSELLSVTTNEPKNLKEDELQIIIKIKKETTAFNRNNLTRTEAYLQYYHDHPEIHWSFLAHMVSRNGGWNMTDLKGSLIQPFLPKNKTKIFFEFLEKANALIFQDAYPQLLLYHFSKKYNKNYFHLLSYFNVSTFMVPIWNYFWKTQNSPLLTVALIINEQNYIQSRIMTEEKYKEEVLQTILFQAQERLGFTDVLFPIHGKKIKLAGVTVQEFNNVFNRIETGKKLYGILFHKIYNGAHTFANRTPHTGSRLDIWPDVFTANRGGKELIYSPYLRDVWPDFAHTFIHGNDWFQSDDMITQLKTYYIPRRYMLTKDYQNDLHYLKVLKTVKEVVT